MSRKAKTNTIDIGQCKNGMRLSMRYKIERKPIIEVKSIDKLADIHLSQMLTYLRLTGCKLGLLMNFNVIKLKDGIKRVANNL